MMPMMEDAGMGKLVVLTIAVALTLAATGCTTGPAPAAGSASMASHGMAYSPTFYSPAMSGEGGGGR
jgi:hypothetical protein